MPRCHSCGQPAETLFPCTWDTRLEVGECCEFHLDDLIETPEDAVCEEEARVFCEGKTVREVVEGIRKHRMNCPTCSAYPMPSLPARSNHGAVVAAINAMGTIEPLNHLNGKIAGQPGETGENLWAGELRRSICANIPKRTSDDPARQFKRAA